MPVLLLAYLVTGAALTAIAARIGRPTWWEGLVCLALSPAAFALTTFLILGSAGYAALRGGPRT